MAGWAKGLAGAIKRGMGKVGGSLLSAPYSVVKGGAISMGEGGFREGAFRFGSNFALQTGMGGAMAMATGDESFLYTGMAMGAVGGVGSIFRGGDTRRLAWSGRMLAGQAIGGAMGQPLAGPIAAAGYGALKSPMAKFMGEGIAGGAKGSLGYAANLARAPFQPRKAFKYLATADYPAGSPFMLGVFGGAGWGAARIAGGAGEKVTEGIFPGGTTYMGAGNRVMGFNHMETAGLTLAIHNRGRGNRVM